MEILTAPTDTQGRALADSPVKSVVVTATGETLMTGTKRECELYITRKVPYDLAVHLENVWSLG